MLKLLIRKNRTVLKKLIIDKLLFNDIYTTFEIAYMFNGAQSFPHTDGMKKILSLLLYFPDEKISNEQKNKLGAFYNSDEFNLSGLGKNKVNSFESESFKNRNKIVGTFPFEKNLYGFIKSHKSWHSVDLFISRKILLGEILI